MKAFEKGLQFLAVELALKHSSSPLLKGNHLLHVTGSAECMLVLSMELVRTNGNHLGKQNSTSSVNAQESLQECFT